MYSSYFDFSFDNFLIFLFHFSYVSHIFFHSFSVPTDASRSRQELSNEYLIVKIGVDPDENGPLKVWNRKTDVLVTKFDE